MHAETIILPGIGGSGNDHWQTLWTKRGVSGPAFHPSSWVTPDLDDWIAALERAVRNAERPPLLVAHSLACLLVAHWAAKQTCRVAGAGEWPFGAALVEAFRAGISKRGATQGD